MSTVFRPGSAAVLGVAATIAAFAAGLFARQPDVERAVLAAIDRVNAAFQARDVAAYEALTTPGFVRVTSNGRVFGRAEWLKRSVAAPGPARPAGTYDQSSVRIYGSGAVVTYRSNPDGKGGVPAWLTRVMERQGTEWRMALAMSTDLKAPAAPVGPEPAGLPAWSATTAAEKDALAGFDAIQKANRDRDLALWERHSAPDHVIIAADATRASRADRVAQLQAPPAANAPAPGAQTQVRLILAGSELAAVTWTTPTARSLKVMARQNGVWRQVLQQSAPIVRTR